jgi:hypothetical protein
MVKETDAAITHPEAVMVHPHHTAITDLVAVFRTGRHNLTTRLAKTEFANLRDLFSVFSKDLGNCFALWNLKKLHVIFVHFNSKLTWGLLVGHLDVAKYCSVETLELVMGPCFKV